MSYKLTNLVKLAAGLTMGEKSILFRLADASRDGQTASMGVFVLAVYTGCDERTARRLLRRLEKLNVLVPIGTAGGMGHILMYQINVSHLPKITVRQPHPVRLRRIPDNIADEDTHKVPVTRPPAPPLKYREDGTVWLDEKSEEEKAKGQKWWENWRANKAREKALMEGNQK
jgi:hypothetical protein